MRDPRLWDAARLERFRRDWNDELDLDAIREKYGIPAGKVRRFVQNLREQGHTLVPRRGVKG
jgi:hypothetical protein